MTKLTLTYNETFSAPKKQMPRWKLILLLLAPSMILFLSLNIYPLVYNIYLASHWIDMSNPTNVPAFVGWENFGLILSNPLVLWALLRTFIYTAIVVLVEFILALAVAVLLNREFAGKRFFIPFVIVPLMVTPAVSGKIWLYLYNGDYGIVPLLFSFFGLEGVNFLAHPILAFIGVIIQDVWHWTPFLILLFYAGLLSLAKEPFEAAAIDGASAWYTFRHVTLPMLKRVFIIGVLIRGMDAFKMFDELYNMTMGGPGDATENITFYIYKYTFQYFNMGEGAAMALVVFLIILVLSMVFYEVMRERGDAA